MSSNTYYSTVISRFFAVFVFQLSTRFRNFSTAFQILKSFKYLSRSNIAKCWIFSEIEGKVSLKRRILPKGLGNMVPLSESPTYPGSHLSEVFLMKFDKEVHGT